MGLKPDQGVTLRCLWAGRRFGRFSNMSFPAPVLIHAQSIIFVKQSARKNVLTTSGVNFFCQRVGLTVCRLPGMPDVFWWSETLEKRVFYYSWIIAKIFLENWRIDFENYDYTAYKSVF